MSQETRSQAFHRLAQNRRDALLDKVRLFGQLSGPSYDWTPDEVWSYFSEITQALEQALLKFQEQKRWGPSPASTAPAEAQPDDEAPAASADIMILDELEQPPLTKEQRRKIGVAVMMRAAEEDLEGTLEMIILQREVINDLQAKLDACRGGNPAEA